MMETSDLKERLCAPTPPNYIFTKERIEELLSLPRPLGELCPPDSFVPDYKDASWCNKRGLTKQEHSEILRVWRAMDGDACYYTAWMKIVREHVSPTKG